MEQCEILEQMKFQSAVDDITKKIPELDQLVIGWVDTGGLTHWTSVCSGNPNILWILECIKYDILSEQVRED